MSDESLSETSEQDHRHICPACGDGWIHANDGCGPGIDAAWTTPLGHMWALCPMCETQVP